MITALRIHWRRPEVQLGLIALAMAIAAFWSHSVMSKAREAAFSQDRDLIACERIAPEIESWRKKPLAAQAQALQQPELNQRIEKAAAAAGFSQGSIDRISPEEPRRMADSVYKEVPVQVPVKGITLRQLALFLHRLSDPPAASETSSGGGGGQLRVHAVRLTAPRGEETGDRWRAEITLTYLIYSPPVALGQEKPSRGIQ